jgi:hypothetical protein
MTRKDVRCSSEASTADAILNTPETMRGKSDQLSVSGVHVFSPVLY